MKEILADQYDSHLQVYGVTGVDTAPANQGPKSGQGLA